MRSSMFRGAALALVTASLVASGCSSSPPGSQSANKLMPQVQALIRQAKSVRMTGKVTHGSDTISVDLSFSGNSTAGTLGVQGGNLTLLALNGHTYIKVDAAFLKFANAPTSACVAICGKYVKIPASQVGQVTGSISWHSFATQVFSNKNFNSAEASGCVFSPATVHGQSVLQCSQGQYTIDVAAHGKPYVLYLSGPHGEYLTFSDWNTAVLPPEPPASQVIDLNSLG